MEFTSFDRVYAAIDLNAIEENCEEMKRSIKEGTKIVAVIKTDGYGHGSVPIAKKLEPKEYIWGFAVATYEEARELRTEGIQKPILILGYTFPACYEDLIEEDIRPAVFRMDTLEILNELAQKQNKIFKVHVKVDTGMGRIGISPDEKGLAFVEKLLSLKNLEMEGMFTHFAKADETDKTHVHMQLSTFKNFTELVEGKFSVKIPFKHCSNSAGIMDLPEANMNLVRAGIILYGLYPSDEVMMDALKLKPALSLYSHIAYIKEMQPGQTVSYGGTYVAAEPIKLATVPVGYGDGYPRSLSNLGYVLIHGKKAPICGRVCMDQMMVDVTHIDQTQEGDLVTLIGADGEENITCEMLGELSHRFNYELVCDINHKRVPRVYL